MIPAIMSVTLPPVIEPEGSLSREPEHGHIHANKGKARAVTRERAATLFLNRWPGHGCFTSLVAIVCHKLTPKLTPTHPSCRTK
jgi:hypothetical protein